MDSYPFFHLFHQMDENAQLIASASDLTMSIAQNSCVAVAIKALDPGT